MGWDNDHMHGFSPKEINGKSISTYTEFSIYAPGWEDDPHPVFKTDQIKVSQINFQKYPKWNFVFDFGDGHEFDVELKETRAKNSDRELSKEDLPTCIDQRGVAPLQYPDCDDFEESDFGEVTPDIKEALKLLVLNLP